MQVQPQIVQIVNMSKEDYGKKVQQGDFLVGGKNAK